MSSDLRGEWKLLKVWECHRCKALIRIGRDASSHKCEIKETELSISNKIVEEQKNLIGEQRKTIDLQKGEIVDKSKFIEQQENTINKDLNKIKDQNITIEEQNKVIEYYKKKIESQDLVIEEQNKFIKDKTAEDQYKIIEDQKRLIEGHRRAIDNQKKSMDEKDLIIFDQKKIIESQKRIIIEKEDEIKTAKKKIPEIRHKDNGGIRVEVLGEGGYIKDSKDIGYREDIEIDIFAKGRGRDRIIIKNGRLIKKPEDIKIIGEQTSEGFIIKGIYKN